MSLMSMSRSSIRSSLFSNQRPANKSENYGYGPTDPSHGMVLLQCSRNCSQVILFPPTFVTFFLSRLSLVTSVKLFLIAVSAISASVVFLTYDLPASGFTEPRSCSIRSPPLDHFALFHFEMFQTADSVETKPFPRTCGSSGTRSWNIRQSFILFSAHGVSLIWSRWT